jgi:hypothetical protein
MALAPVRFGPKAGVTTYTDTTAGRYTPTASTAIVKQVVFCNTAGTAATVTLGVGTSDTAANRLISSMSIAANETMTYNTNVYLTSSEKLYFITSATTVTVTINSYEE